MQRYPGPGPIVDVRLSDESDFDFLRTVRRNREVDTVLGAVPYAEMVIERNLVFGHGCVAIRRFVADAVALDGQPIGNLENGDLLPFSCPDPDRLANGVGGLLGRVALRKDTLHRPVVDRPGRSLAPHGGGEGDDDDGSDHELDTFVHGNPFAKSTNACVIAGTIFHLGHKNIAQNSRFVNVCSWMFLLFS